MTRRQGGGAWRYAHLIHASRGSHRSKVNRIISPNEYTDRHTSTLGSLDPAMAEAPPRTGTRQIPVTGPDLEKYRPTDTPVTLALWIPPWPRQRGWGANAQIPLRAPFPKRSRLDHDRLKEQPDKRFGWTRPPRKIGLRQYTVNPRFFNPYDFVVLCFEEIY